VCRALRGLANIKPYDAAPCCNCEPLCFHIELSDTRFSVSRTSAVNKLILKGGHSQAADRQGYDADSTFVPCAVEPRSTTTRDIISPPWPMQHSFLLSFRVCLCSSPTLAFSLRHCCAAQSQRPFTSRSLAFRPSIDRYRLAGHKRK
jgi:hypothetical protein